MTDTLQLEKTLWQAADKLRNNMDAAEYKHVVLGLIFLKYISDAFDEHYRYLKSIEAETGADPEDKDEYTADKIFYVPPSARWKWLQGRAKLPTIGKDIDDAMDAIEKDNPSLKGVLPKDYARPALDKQRLGELIDLIGSITLSKNGSGKGKDVLGFVFEYFLGQFADAEGKKGGQFYTPQSIVKLLVEMLSPEAEKRVYDGACGSGGMFVQSEDFIEIHEHRKGKISIFGQESNPTTYKLAKMNLAIRGIDAKIELGDTLMNDKFPELKVDYVIANPPFNVSDYNINKAETHKWKYGIPPTGNANYAWLQHFVSKLAPYGTAGIVLANGSMSSEIATEGQIRKELIEADLVDCMVALPSQLFYNTQISACLWFLARNKEGNSKLRNRNHEVLFIDARELGTMISRKQRELTDIDIFKVAETYHNWRSPELFTKDYQDVPGFCKSANIQEVRKNNYILTPGRYIDFKAVEDDGVAFEEKMQNLTATLAEQMQKANELDEAIKNNLAKIGFKING
ncbi:type I restriction-modification system subunit M [Chryseobacterium luteum]|uniref:site-specific DNA-methyltransferase (adenine-specific) n=1 Tax=Chryseobacterium luteum TaxID=421531 RepID=A0A085ZC80_9FLAO|nr:class I SAM-dependent DNA methyltransferase [Chryseobacterium luteum]KFF02044.1 N-6 DNA methylase [Chryseobacterium luteum]